MDLATIINRTLATAKAATPGTLLHAGNSYSVALAYSVGHAETLLPAGVVPAENEISALVSVADLAAPVPSIGDPAEVAGTLYRIASVQKNPLFWQLSLSLANVPDAMLDEDGNPQFNEDGSLVLAQ